MIPFLVNVFGENIISLTQKYLTESTWSMNKACVVIGYLLRQFGLVLFVEREFLVYSPSDLL